QRALDRAPRLFRRRSHRDRRLAGRQRRHALPERSVASAARYPLRRDAQLCRAGAARPATDLDPRRRPCQWRQSHQHRRALPPRHRIRRLLDWLWRRHRAQALAARARARAPARRGLGRRHRQCSRRRPGAHNYANRGEVMTTKPDLAARFHQLHRGPDLLVLANCWDAGSARLSESLGARAIATTSAGLAWSHGYPDGDALPTSLLIATVAAATRVISVPLSI